MSSNFLSEENMILCPILSEDYYSKDIQTIEVLIAEIKIKTKISEIVNYLSKTIGLKDLNHLKRIKSNDCNIEVIICINNKQNKQLLEEINDFLIENDLLPLKARQVPKCAPKSQTQYELSSKLWPISFHPNKYLEKCLNSTLFDSNERKTIFNIISKAIEMSGSNEEKPSMVTIVTDSSHNIITSCKSEVESHPLRHSILVAIDSVAQQQRADTVLLKTENRVNSISYLCTGFDFYTTAEPCIMCAMALVHSRIRRLFFLESNNSQISNECTDRAITLHKFHLLPKLNHHFESWKICFK